MIMIMKVGLSFTSETFKLDCMTYFQNKPSSKQQSHLIDANSSFGLNIMMKDSYYETYIHYQSSKTILVWKKTFIFFSRIWMFEIFIASISFKIMFIGVFHRDFFMYLQIYSRTIKKGLRSSPKKHTNKHYVFKYYISKIKGGRVYMPLLILLMQVRGSESWKMRWYDTWMLL